MRTKLLFVIDGLEFGGGERGFLQLANGLSHRFEVFVATMPGGRFEQGIKELGIRFYPVEMSRRLSLKPIWELMTIIRNKKIEIVHSQGARADFFARIAARLAKAPILISTVQMPVEGYDVNPVRKSIYVAFDRLLERFVDKFIVVSKSLEQVLIKKHKIRPDKVVLIHNGIEVDEYKSNVEEVRSPREGSVAQRVGRKLEARSELGLRNDAPVVGAIGRLVWQKGFEYLIEAIPEIIKTFAKTKILIIGDGPLRKRLEALSEELRVKDNVIFAGFRSDIKEMLSTIDILVIPSLLEGFPMITLEAMAMAKPIVATGIDGITEQITNGVNGILVPPKDPSALAKGIIKVLNDKELARNMGLAAREKVEQEFSVEKMISETEKVYLSLLKAG